MSVRGAVCLGGCIPACNEADTPPVGRITDRCKKITLLQLRLRAINSVMNLLLFEAWFNYKKIFKTQNENISKKRRNIL